MLTTRTPAGPPFCAGLATGSTIAGVVGSGHTPPGSEPNLPAARLGLFLARIGDHPVNEIHRLLPWNMAPSLETHTTQAA